MYESKRKFWTPPQPKNDLIGPKKAQNDPKNKKVRKNLTNRNLSVYMDKPQKHFFMPYCNPKYIKMTP